MMCERGRGFVRRVPYNHLRFVIIRNISAPDPGALQIPLQCCASDIMISLPATSDSRTDRALDPSRSLGGRPGRAPDMT